MNTRCERPITEQEKLCHFKRGPKGQPWYQMAVIRMNSTYLECVDRLFEERGMATAVGIICMGMILWLVGGMTLLVIDGWSDLSPDGKIEDALFIVVVFAMAIIPTMMVYWLLKQECFHYTHYPIRFNRKTRQVYMFRLDGTVMRADWDTLYFTIDTQSYGRRRVAALILAEDQKTVLEFFDMPFVTDKSDHERMYSFYEFVRRYMDEDETQVAELAKQIDYAPNIVNKRQSFFGGAHYMDVMFTGRYLHLRIGYYLTMLPFYIVGRWVAMHTCKIPRWPEDVEQECQFEPDDPNLRDAKHLSPPDAVKMPW